MSRTYDSPIRIISQSEFEAGYLERRGSVLVPRQFQALERLHVPDVGVAVVVRDPETEEAARASR